MCIDEKIIGRQEAGAGANGAEVVKARDVFKAAKAAEGRATFDTRQRDVSNGTEHKGADLIVVTHLDATRSAAASREEPCGNADWNKIEVGGADPAEDTGIEASPVIGRLEADGCGLRITPRSAAKAVVV